MQGFQLLTRQTPTGRLGWRLRRTHGGLLPPFSAAVRHLGQKLVTGVFLQFCPSFGWQKLIEERLFALSVGWFPTLVLMRHGSSKIRISYQSHADKPYE